MVSWIKLSVNIFEDEKIKIIESMTEGPQKILIWIKLLALAGKTNREGVVTLTETKAYTSENLATIFRMPIELVNQALKTFQDFGMVSIDENNRITVTHWSKYQNVEEEERIQEKTRERKKSEVLKLTNELEQNSEEQAKKKERICKTFEEYVELTEEEYLKLNSVHGEEKTQRFIVKLNDYIGQQGKNPYKNHYYTILNWMRREAEGGGRNGGNFSNATKLQNIKNPVSSFGKFTIFDSNGLQRVSGT